MYIYIHRYQSEINTISTEMLVNTYNVYISIKCLKTSFRLKVEYLELEFDLLFIILFQKSYTQCIFEQVFFISHFKEKN